MTTFNNVSDMLKALNGMNLTGTDATNANNVRSELETLFTEDATLNGGQKGADEIQKKIDELESQINKLKKKAEDIKKDIDGKNGELKNQTDKLSDSASKLMKGTADFKEVTRLAAQSAAAVAIEECKNANSSDFDQRFKQEFEKKLGHYGGTQADIQRMFEDFEANKDGIKDITGDINNAIGNLNNLEGQLKNVDVTITMLTRTKNIMKDSQIKDAYKNSDMNADVPIFSGEKAELANKLLETFQSRKSSDKDTAKGKDGKANAEQQKLMDGFSDKNTTKYDKSMGDIYNAKTNPELQNLRDAINDGMLDKLKKSGLSNAQIMEFVSKNWKVGIKFDKENNSWSIPKGHDKDCWTQDPAYNALADLMNTKEKSATANDVNQVQLKELMEAMDPKSAKNKAAGGKDILTQMYEAGFTFKEMMYTMTKLFPNAGLGYDLNSQSKERNYTIVKDTNKTGSLFANISKSILEKWNVGSTDKKTPDDTTPKPADRTDPITFQAGGTNYAFLKMGALDDGKFNYKDGYNNDLMGSEKGIEELLALDTNGDGVIDNNDVMKDKNGNVMKDKNGNPIKVLDQLTLLANKQDESVGNSKDVYNYKTGKNYKGKGAYTNGVDFNVSYATASQLGITSIDLKGLTKGTGSGEALGKGGSTKNYDGTQEEYEDINGSSVINSFGITMGGKEYSAKETLNTQENLQTFFGQIAKFDGTKNAAFKETKDNFNKLYDDPLKNEAAKDAQKTIDDIKDYLEELQKQKPDTGIYDGITQDTIYYLTGDELINAMRIKASNDTRDEFLETQSEDKGIDASVKSVEDFWGDVVFNGKEPEELEKDNVFRKKTKENEEK